MKLSRTLILSVVVFITFGTAAVGAEEITALCGEWVTDRDMARFKEMFGYDLVEKFAEETGITVKLEAYPFRQLFQVIEVKLTAKDPKVDILWVDSPLTASYAVRGYTKPVGEELLSKEELKDFFPATVEIATWDGKLYNVPFQTSSQVMYINKELFQKAGVEPPVMDVNKRWTWAQVVDAAQKIQDAINTEGQQEVWGLLFQQVSRPYQMLALPQSIGGGSGVSPDGLEVDGYLNNEGWVKAMQWWYDTYNTWNISPKGTKPAESDGLFSAGKVAMLVGGTWAIPGFMEAKNEGRLDFDIVPHPYFAEGKPVTGTNSWHLAISPYSKNPEAAAKFIKYMVGKETSEKFFRSNGQLTAHTAMIEVINTAPEYKSFPWNSYKDVTTYEVANTAVPRPTTPFFLEWEDAVAKAFEDIRNGGDPKKTLDQYVSILERVARKYK